jgi:hypothetical protein
MCLRPTGPPVSILIAERHGGPCVSYNWQFIRVGILKKE